MKFELMKKRRIIPYIFIYLILSILFSSCKTIKDIDEEENISSDCPYNAKYKYANFHSMFDSCFYDLREYYGYGLLEPGKYGYDVKEELDFARYLRHSPEKAYQLKAIELSPLTIDLIDFEKFENLEFIRLDGFDEFPVKVYEMSELKVLSILSRGLKTIPDGINSLDSLRILEIFLADNLTYISNELKELTTLEVLELNRSYKIDSFDLDFSKFINLERLIMTECKFINSTIASCPSLNYLRVDMLQDYYADIVNLQTLAIDNRSAETEFTNLTKAKKLKELYLHGKISPKIVKSISRIPNLEYLGIAITSNSIDWNLEKFQFEKLKYLHVNSEYLTEFPKFRSPKLSYLSIVSPYNEKGLNNINDLYKYKNLKFVNFLIKDKETTKSYYDKLKTSKLKLLNYGD